MRILVLTQYYYPHTGGSQEYIAQLYKHLSAAHKDVSVDVICYNTDAAPAFEKMGSLSVYRVGCLEILKGQFALPNYFELVQLLRKLKSHHTYDYVNAHTRFFDNSWWGPLAAKYLSSVSVLTDHCADHPVHSNPALQFVIQKLDAGLATVVPRLFDQVVVISKATGKFLQNYSLERMPPVVYAGVNQEFSKKQKKPLLTVPKNYQVVTFLGRMIPSKNPEALLRAAKTVLQKHKKVLFVFAGDGSEYARLKDTASKNIVFLGKIDKKAAAALLQQTDIFVHPSYHHEGLPISILEAGLSGCAVIATDKGATREVILNNQTGILLKTGDHLDKALLKLLEDRKLQKKLGTALKRKVSNEFNWEKSAETYFQLLRSFK